jgi:hypothetical protein
MGEVAALPAIDNSLRAKEQGRKTTMESVDGFLAGFLRGIAAVAEFFVAEYLAQAWTTDNPFAGTDFVGEEGLRHLLSPFAVGFFMAQKEPGR